MQKKPVCCGKLLRVAVRSFLAVVLLHGCDQARMNLARYSESGRQEVIVLHDITSDQGKAFLDELGLGTVSSLPDHNAVSVAGSPGELWKARVVLELVDKKKEYVIETLASAAAFGLIETKDDEFVTRTSAPALKVRTLPTNDQIARDLGDITIGTFTDPPQSGGHPQAIVDVHGGSVLAIVPACRLQEILAAVKLGSEAVERQRGAAPQYARADEGSGPAIAEQRIVEPPSKPVEPGTSGTKASTEMKAEPDAVIGPKATAMEEGSATSDRISDSTVAPYAAPNSTRSPLQSAKLGAYDPAPSIQRTTRPGAVANADALLAEQAQDVGPRGVVSGPAVASATDPNSEVRGATAKPSGNAAKATTVAQAYQIESLANANDILELDLPEKIELIRLLDLVGEYLHLDYMYDPDKIKNQMVTLKLRGKLQGEIRVKDLYSLLESVLNFKGFVMTRHEGNIVTIAPVADVMQVDPELVDSDSQIIDAGDMVVTRMFELEYIDTFSAINLLENMKLTVAVSPVPETQTLIVTCYAYRMPRIERLLAMVDKPGRLRKVRFRQLQYITANMLAEKIKTLAAELETVGVTIALASQTSQQLGGPLPQPLFPTPNANRVTGGMASGKETVYLDADERTNRIVI